MTAEQRYDRAFALRCEKEAVADRYRQAMDYVLDEIDRAVMRDWVMQPSLIDRLVAGKKEEQ